SPLFAFLGWVAAPPGLPSFPTRRSSDLLEDAGAPPRLVPGHRAPASGIVLAPQAHLVAVVDHRRTLAREQQAEGEHGRRLILTRSEEHTSELQSRENLVCRLLLEKKSTT